MRAIIVTLTILVVSQSSLGCKPSMQTQANASNTYWWSGRKGASCDWRCGGAYIYASSGVPHYFDLWKWNGGDLEKCREIGLQRLLCPAVLGEEHYLSYVGADQEQKFIALANMNGDAANAKWSSTPGWWCFMMQSSRAGGHAAICYREDVGTLGPKDRDPEQPRVRVYLISRDKREPELVGTLIGTYSGSDGNIRTVLPSDDGAYVAVGAWDHGVAMIDAAKGETLWSKRPPNEVASYYLAFSPDNRLIYGGGGEGCVYGMDVLTGEIRSQWYASVSGQSEYGHRICYLAASSDGRWVAAGTGPEGLIWIWRASDGKVVAILEHGSGTVQLVQFSPDSQALATIAAGSIKIWSVTKWGTNDTVTK